MNMAASATANRITLSFDETLPAALQLLAFPDMFLAPCDLGGVPGLQLDSAPTLQDTAH